MRKPKRFLVEDYVDGILSSNRMMLSRALTLVESSLNQDYDLAQAVIAQCIAHKKSTYRIGISGVPGAGKSTFIEAFGSMLVNEKQQKVAVLTIDPSSEISGGSILGDKTRMHTLASHPNAFIRPSPSAGSLGGVARKTRESLILCEAAGFDVIIVETVGVGQSETMVSDMTDFFLLLMLPNAGDELQGIKKGIMEKADALLINKSDGEFLPKARLAQVLYSQALRLFPAKEMDWKPKVMMCSALEKTGIVEVWEMLLQYQILAKECDFWQNNRQSQNQKWMLETVQNRLKDIFFQNITITEKIPYLEKLVKNNTLSPLKAADELIQLFMDDIKKY